MQDKPPLIENSNNDHGEQARSATLLPDLSEPTFKVFGRYPLWAYSRSPCIRCWIRPRGGSALMTTQARPAAGLSRSRTLFTKGLRGKENLATAARYIQPLASPVDRHAAALGPRLARETNDRTGRRCQGRGRRLAWRSSSRCAGGRFPGARPSLASPAACGTTPSISEARARLRSATRDNGLGDCKNRR